MLVLSRKKGESIIIGDNIEIVVISTEGDTVKVGVRAPKQVEVYRKEVYDAIRQANREASTSSFAIEGFRDLLRKDEENGDK